MACLRASKHSWSINSILKSSRWHSEHFTAIWSHSALWLPSMKSLSPICLQPVHLVDHLGHYFSKCSTISSLVSMLSVQRMHCKVTCTSKVLISFSESTATRNGPYCFNASGRCNWLATKFMGAVRVCRIGGYQDLLAPMTSHLGHLLMTKLLLISSSTVMDCVQIWHSLNLQRVQLKVLAWGLIT